MNKASPALARRGTANAEHSCSGCRQKRPGASGRRLVRERGHLRRSSFHSHSESQSLSLSRSLLLAVFKCKPRELKRKDAVKRWTRGRLRAKGLTFAYGFAALACGVEFAMLKPWKSLEDLV